MKFHRNHLVATVTFLFGAAVGWGVAFFQSAEPPTPKSGPALRGRGNPTLTARHGTPDRTNIETRPTHEKREPGEIVIPPEALPALVLNLFTVASEVPDAKQIMRLGCSGETAEQVKLSAAKALNSLKDLEKAHSRIVKSEAGEYIEIDPFPAEGEAIKNRMNSEIRDALPDGRAEILISNFARNIRFGQFGVERRELSAEATRHGDTEIWGYTLRSGNPGTPMQTVGGSGYNELFGTRYKHLLRTP